jgi:hypothetical protein
MNKDEAHRKLERNDPCHCGSGKKYKNCCFVKDQEADAAELMSRESAALQNRLNPEEAPPADILLRPRSSVIQQMNRGELFWAALREGGGGEIPEVPPLISKGPYEIAEGLRSPPQKKNSAAQLRCPSCGVRIEADSVFCDQCGRRVRA